jgi:hypothetical protein
MNEVSIVGVEANKTYRIGKASDMTFSLDPQRIPVRPVALGAASVLTLAHFRMRKSSSTAASE